MSREKPPTRRPVSIWEKSRRRKQGCITTRDKNLTWAQNNHCYCPLTAGLSIIYTKAWLSAGAVWVVVVLVAIQSGVPLSNLESAWTALVSHYLPGLFLHYYTHHIHQEEKWCKQVKVCGHGRNVFPYPHNYWLPLWRTSKTWQFVCLVCSLSNTILGYYL